MPTMSDAMLGGFVDDLDAELEGSIAWAVVEVLRGAQGTAGAATHGSREAVADLYAQLAFAAELLARLRDRAEVVQRVAARHLLFAQRRAES